MIRKVFKIFFYQVLNTIDLLIINQWQNFLYKI